MIDHLADLALTFVHPATILLPTVVLAVVLLPLAWGLARAVGGVPVAAAGATLALIGVADVTVLRPGLLHADADWSRVAIACVVTDPGGLSAETVLNIALFVPFALLAVVAVGRAVPPTVAATGVVLAVSALSLGIEAGQAAYRIGACDSSDVVHNVLGGALGAAFGLLVLGCTAGPGARRAADLRSLDDSSQRGKVVRVQAGARPDRPPGTRP